MGQEQSSVPEHGYHVLRVSPNSPGARAGLVAYFDFIVGVGERRLDSEDATLTQALAASLNRELRLTVFNTRLQTCRTVPLVPSVDWGGQGCLGVSIRFCSLKVRS